MGNRNSTDKVKRNPSINKTNNRSHIKKEFEPTLPSTLPTSPTSPTSSNEEKETLKYYLPNDNNDIDRQHAHHFIKRYLFQSYFSAPIVIGEGVKVLDVGCGAGTWLLDLANEYKDSIFYGLDIAPVFPAEIKPENLTFIKEDIFNGLPFPDNTFDFVHMETMAYILTPEKWHYAISELIRVTKPEGYMELSEAYYNKNEGFGPIYIKLAEAIYKSSLQRGVDLKFTDQLESVLRSRQTIMNVDIDEKVVIIGPNGGKVGTIFMDLYIQFCSTDSAVEGLCPYLNMSKDEYKEFIFKDYRNEICQSKNTKLYMVRYWAQKVNNN